MMRGMILYDVGIEFTTGSVRREVCTSQGEEQAKLLALVDARMTAGPGISGELVSYDVKVVQNPSEVCK